jgi:hypothetical protein
MMVVTSKEATLQGKEMSMLSTRQSRAKKWRNNRKQTEKVNMQQDCDTKKVLLDVMVLD